MRITRTDGTLIGEFASVAEAVESGANLSGADLSGANLSGADLRWTNLREANLRGANLREANLRGANLCEANLRGANLCGANLYWANLREADLSGANLCGANLDGVRWNSSILTNTVGAPWHFGLGRHVAIVHEGQISIGCMTETVDWWREHYEAVGKEHHYSEAEIAEYGAWIQFVADRLKLRGAHASAAQEERC